MRIVELKIEDEYVIGGGVVVGAAGSANDVVLEMTFSSFWDGLAKSVTFLDANGENPTIVQLLEHAPQGTNVYCVPVPAEAKAVAGEIFMSVRGVQTKENEQAVIDRASMSVKTTFRVLESVYDEDAAAAQDLTPTQAEQFASRLSAIEDTIDAAIESEQNAAASAAEAQAWAIGTEDEEKQQHNNSSKDYAQAAQAAKTGMDERIDEIELALKDAGCVYVGGGEMPKGFNVQIDPDGTEVSVLGDMSSEVYDPDHKGATAGYGDVYAYADAAKAAANDYADEKIAQHAEDEDAHGIPTLAQSIQAELDGKANLQDGKLVEIEIPEAIIVPKDVLAYHVAHRAAEGARAGTKRSDGRNLVLCDFSLPDCVQGSTGSYVANGMIRKNEGTEMSTNIPAERTQFVFSEEGTGTIVLPFSPNVCGTLETVTLRVSCGSITNFQGDMRVTVEDVQTQKTKVSSLSAITVKNVQSVSFDFSSETAFTLEAGKLYELTVVAEKTNPNDTVYLYLESETNSFEFNEDVAKATFRTKQTKVRAGGKLYLWMYVEGLPGADFSVLLENDGWPVPLDVVAPIEDGVNFDQNDCKVLYFAPTAVDENFSIAVSGYDGIGIYNLCGMVI